MGGGPWGARQCLEAFWVVTARGGVLPRLEGTGPGGCCPSHSAQDGPSAETHPAPDVRRANGETPQGN